MNPPSEADLAALLSVAESAGSLAALTANSSLLPVIPVPSAVELVTSAQPGVCAYCSGTPAKNCTLLGCQRCCIARMGHCYIYRHQQVKLSSLAVYTDFRTKITATLATSQQSRPVLYIMYQGAKDSEPRYRSILPLRWWVPDRSYKSFVPESAVLARCMENPTDTTEKHFKLLRMYRVELAPFK